MKEKYRLIYLRNGEAYERGRYIKKRDAKENFRLVAKNIGEKRLFIVKIPFRKRHPDFPIYLQLVALLMIILKPIVDLCIHHILRIVQELQLLW